MKTVAEAATVGDLSVGLIGKEDVGEADRVFRLAFGTALGLPNPLAFGAGAELVRTRWAADPASAFKATVEDRLVGCAFVSRWGRFAVFGPLAVHPDYWDRGVGTRLWEARLPLLDRWQTTHEGLFTRADSTKHLRLYQTFDFWPRFLTAITSKEIGRESGSRPGRWTTMGRLGAAQHELRLEACRSITDALLVGLDLEREIRAVLDQQLGDTILLGEPASLEGFAVCHVGEGTEAGPDACFVKFAAVRPGARAAQHFEELLDACEEFAVESAAARLVAGVNVARHEAYRALLARGHRTFVQGVAMHRGNQPCYSRPGVYALDDWR
ncbi:MAG TPA: GNAT family N-acetyltransferase [Gaiellaceae bacterium]|nr:GNAT family N-acetyltransferase [Gaiellaceae bacterium]